MRPRATYRLQLSPSFTFADATAAIPYLVELGVSHLYLSPILQAAAGSTHGYDVVDPTRVSDELGGEAGFSQLAAAAHAAGLGLLLDIVPNHMSIAGTRNHWWLDVLENGPASYYAHFFDVDWASAGDNRVLLPMLGERYGRALTTGTLAIEHAGGTFNVRAHDTRLPIAPRSIGAIVRRAGDRVRNTELQFVGDALAELPSPQDRDVAARRRRHRDKAVLLRRLRELAASSPELAAALDAEVAAIDRDPAELDVVLEAQNYRLVHWTVAGSQLSYRRFFDISTLVGIRNEDLDVFETSHQRILDWLADGTIDGVRIDHVDGLREPGGYLERLRARAPAAWILVEKILGDGERLPPAWPIDGTTGYDFMETAGRLIVDPGGEEPLTTTFEAYTGEVFAPALESRRARHDVMTDALHSELVRLTELAARTCAGSPACRDYTRAEIETALAEILAGYPTYRTYLGEGDGARPEDRARIAVAVEAAAVARPELDADLLAFLEAALAFELPTPDALELARAAQQVSGPIVAKGDEDTLLYRQVRLVARCEVAAHLAHFGAEAAELHAELARGARRSLLATSTHDTKRSEDVRARIAALSEHPARWREAVMRWRARAEAGWGEIAPDRCFEYLMWQTLVGAWPLSAPRAQLYAEKATREARRRTSWRRPDLAYEDARARWLAGVYADRELVAEIAGLAERLAPHGDRNVLAMLLVKLTAPGVPDLYQGTELRAATLVDPDNRGTVDLEARRRLLHELETTPLDVIASDLDRAKLHVIRRVLALRARRGELFDAPYQALAAAGAHAPRVFAFARGDALVAVVPRGSAGAGSWHDTMLALPAGSAETSWRDILSDRTLDGGTIAVGELWRDLPIALLVRADLVS